MVFQPKLTDEQRSDIITSTDKPKDLATKHGVSVQTVYNIRQTARDQEEKPNRIRAETPRIADDWADMDYTPEDTNDRLWVPPEIIPDGMSYQWCTAEVYGQPQPQRISWFQRQGWRPVPAERHPGRWTPLGATGSIIVDGLMLCERPQVFTDRARAHENAKARQQMEIKKAQLKGGDMPGVTGADHLSAIRSNYVKSEFERISIPSDD